MKKLALASVAFAAVSAFGAGNAFATAGAGVHFYDTPTAFDSAPATTNNDSMKWGVLTGSTSGIAAGPISQPNPAQMTQPSTLGNVDVTESYRNPNTTSPSQLSVLFQGSGVFGGFVHGQAVLTPNGTGPLTLTFSKPIDAVGFTLGVPFGFTTGQVGDVYTAVVTVSGGGVATPQTHDFAGTLETACTSAPCNFVGITSSKGFTTLGFSVSFTDPIPAPVGLTNLEISDSSPAAIPEPASLAVLGIGLLGLGSLRKRRTMSAGGGTRWSPFGRWRVAAHPPGPTTPP